MLSSLEKGVIPQHQAGEIAFIRLFQDILQQPMDKSLAQALLQDMPDEIPDIRHVLTMQEDEIDNLTYAVLTKREEDDAQEQDDEEGKESKPSIETKGTTIPPPERTQLLPLHRSYKRLVKVIIAYNEYRHAQNSPIMDD